MLQFVLDPARPAPWTWAGRRGVRHATDNFSTAAMRPTLQEYVEQAARAGRGQGAETDGRTGKYMRHVGLILLRLV